MNSASTQLPYADLPSDKVAQLRQYIRQNSATYGMATVDKLIQQKYGVSAQQVMEPNPNDFGRSVAQGITLNHADELAGLYAKLTGKSYTEARDAVRNNDTQFQAFHPILKMLTEATAGSIPGLAAAPLAGIQKGATLANIARGAAVGAGSSAVAGEGASNAPTLGGVAKDAAVSGAIGGVLGAGGGAVASRLASGALPKGNAAAVATEAASQLPSNPASMLASMQRQEAMVPGTVVLADQSPQMQKFVRAIGADPKTAMEAVDATAQRVAAIKNMKDVVGSGYDKFAQMTAPVDANLTTVLQQAGRPNFLSKGQSDVNLSDLLDLRKQLLGAARATRNPQVAFDKRQAANGITDWMSQPNIAPDLPTIDQPYAFLTARLNAAKQTQKVLLNSASAYAANRAAGVESGSLGATIPLPGRSAIGTTLAKIVKPDRAARARAISALLLTPQRDDQGMQGLMLTHNALLQSQEAPGATIGNAVLAGGVAPQLASTIATPQQ